MRKFILLLAVLCLAGNLVNAATETVEGITYTYYLTTEGAVIGKSSSSYSAAVSGATANVIVPKTLGGKSVVEIGDYAFYNLDKLETVVLPDTIKRIGKYAFEDCDKLSMITIPSGVTSIGDHAFYYCRALTSIEFPDTVTSIGEYAMYYCTNLRTVKLPSGITSIPDCAFYNCKSLLSINIPVGVKTIKSYAFSDCTNLQSITIPSSVTSIGDYAFDDCDALTSIEIPDSVTSLGQYVMNGCDLLMSVKLSRQLSSIPQRAFQGCVSLQTITLPEGIRSIATYAFAGCKMLQEIVFPSSLISIDDYAFKDCVLLQSVTLPNATSSLGDMAFYGCSNLQRVSLPASLSAIGKGVFRECPKLIEILIDPANKFYMFRESGLYTKDSTELLCFLNMSGTVNICDGVERIDNYVFSAASRISRINLPASITAINANAFTGCNTLTAIDVHCDNKIYASVDGVLYDKGLTTLVKFPNAKTVRSGLPDTLKNIGAYAFNGCALTELVVPTTVIDIGDYAYYGCKAKLILLHSKVERIGNYAFASCGNLTMIQIPPSVSSIGDYAFSNCTALKKLEMQNTVKEVGRSVLAGCANLRSVTVPVAVASLADLFDGYRAPVLDELCFAEGWEIVDLSMFFDCDSYYYNYNSRGSIIKIRVPWSVSVVDYSSYSYSYYLRERNVVFIFEGDKPAFTYDRWFQYVSQNTSSGCAILVKRGTEGWDDYIRQYQGYGRVSFAWYGGDGLVCFDANGGSGMMENQNVTCGLPTALSANTFTRPFYRFVGWAVQGEGTKVAYRDQGEITVAKPMTVNLCAQWEKINVPRIVGASGGVFTNDSCEISIECYEPGAVIYYTTNGVTPRVAEVNRYTGPFEITGDVNIVAVGVVDGNAKSEYVTVPIKKLLPIGFEAAVNATDMEFELGDDARWWACPMIGASDDWCVRSGAIGEGEHSDLRMTVNGSGVLEFDLKVSCEWDDSGNCTWDHFALFVDEKLEVVRDSECDWEHVSVDVVGEGAHQIVFSYLKDWYDEDDFDGEDCAWIDNLVWMPYHMPTVDVVEVITNGTTVVTNVVSVSSDWIADNAETIAGLAGRASVADIPSGELVAVLQQVGANGVPLWQSYVAGLNPAKAESQFRAEITIEDGKVTVEWEPELPPAEAAKRVYTVYGKAELADEWIAVEQDATGDWRRADNGEAVEPHFFKVGVGMR